MTSLKTFFAYDPKDSDKVRLEKFATFLIAGSCCFAGVIWTTMYYAVFGWGLTTLLPAAFVLIVGSALIVSHRLKNHHYAIYAQIICIVFITALIQWSIGAVFDSGFVLVWAFLGPLCALMFYSVRQSIYWFLLYLVILSVTVIFNDVFAMYGQDVSETTKLLFFWMNLGVCSVVVFIFTSYYVNVSIGQREQVNTLLKANLDQELILRQNEKLATLGKLSAGVAHELNNPAAAAHSGTEHLRDMLGKLGESAFNVSQFEMSEAQIQILQQEEALIRQRAKNTPELDPLTRSDQQYEIENWLLEKGVENTWDYAPVLVNIGYSCRDLATLAEHFSDESFTFIIKLFSHTYETHNVLEEIGQGTNRIFEIVKSLKSYTYLDQAPIQTVDLHEGLDDTLVMLRSKLKDGVQVQRDYAENLPCIEAYGSELNQVWTNIIDNAISAMEGKGEITIKTYQQADAVVVEIKDSGPGIPRDVQEKIFDPFFTTKPLGSGTGLGLNISYNIITQKHGGDLSVHSEPGATCFKASLPLKVQGSA